MDENIVWGIKPVSELLRSDRELDKVWLADGLRGTATQEIFTELKKRKIPFYRTPRSKLDSLVGAANHQGVVAQVSSYSYFELEDLFQIASAKNEQPFFLILDHLEDPHNLGAILRTAEGAGVHGVIIPKRRSVAITATVLKVSAGAAAHIAVARVNNLVQTIELLKEKGVWLVGLSPAAGESYDRLDYNLPLAVVIGSEGKGISQLVSEHCDLWARIPMHGEIESLNASVAAALMMYRVESGRRN